MNTEKSVYKASLLWLCKLAAAGALSFLLINLFSFFYYNPPVHIPQTNGITDYKRESDTLWFRGVEGFAMGRTDANGYNNAEVVDTVDILCMGSSQTEGLYVNADEVYTDVLQNMLRENDIALNVYNIGMSAHDIVTNTGNLARALELYHPKYLVMETLTLWVAESQVEEILQDTVPRLQSYSKSDALFWVQKMPYVKLIYLQYKNYKNRNGEDTASDYPENAAASVLAYIKNLCDAYECTPVICYLPTMEFSGDSEHICSEPYFLEYFTESCQQNGIGFINMGETFDREYSENHIVCSGFDNTAICYGHLNRYGHQFIAEEVYKFISSNEKG